MRMHLLLLFILVAPLVSGLALSPARQVYDGGFIISVRDADGPIAARVEGPYADAFTLHVQESTIRGTVDVDALTLPPGDHDHRIIVSTQDSAREGFSAIVELAAIVTLRSTYHGPYLIANGFAEPIDPSMSRVMITIENRGDEAATLDEPVLAAAGRSRILGSVEVPAEGAAQVKETMEGRGQHTLSLRSGEFLFTMPIAIGTPRIISLEAERVPDEGTITPVDVRAVVDWNVPVPGTLTVGTKRFELMLDGGSAGRYYVEDAGEEIPVELVVGSESLIAVATVPQGILPHGGSPSLVIWTLAILAILAVAGFLILYARRH